MSCLRIVTVLFVFTFVVSFIDRFCGTSYDEYRRIESRFIVSCSGYASLAYSSLLLFNFDL